MVVDSTDKLVTIIHFRQLNSHGPMQEHLLNEVLTLLSKLRLILAIG